MNYFPILIALTCILSWSFIPIVATLGQSNIDSLLFLFWSNLLSMIVVGLSLLGSNHTKILNTLLNTNHKKTFILGFLGCFYHYICLYYGYAEGISVEVVVVQYAWPAIVPVFAIFILKEHVSKHKIIAVTLGFFATVLVLTKGNFSTLRFDNISVLLVVLSGSIAFALFSVLSKKYLIKDITANIFMCFFWATVLSFITVMIGSDFSLPTKDNLWTIAINGAFINGLSYILWVYALSKTQASKIAPLVYFSPVFSLFWILLFLGGEITIINLFAMGITIAAGLIVTLEKESN